MTSETEILRKIAIDIAKQAGAKIRQDFVSNIDKEWKADTSPYTKTDLTINELVIDTLSKKTPEISVISEEGSKLVEGSKNAWVCDPLDGTLAFAHGIATCTFSLAYVENGVPTIGVIYDPFVERMIVGVKGAGTTLNGEKVHVTSINDFTKMVIGVPFWKGEHFKSGNLVKELINKGAFVTNFYSITYKGLLVGNGRMCGGIYLDNKAHDVAAVKVIVEEAGGKVTNLLGQDQRYDQNVLGCIFSNGIIHNELLQIIKNTVQI